MLVNSWRCRSFCLNDAHFIFNDCQFGCVSPRSDRNVWHQISHFEMIVIQAENASSACANTRVSLVLRFLKKRPPKCLKSGEPLSLSFEQNKGLSGPLGPLNAKAPSQMTAKLALITRIRPKLPHGVHSSTRVTSVAWWGQLCCRKVCRFAEKQRSLEVIMRTPHDNWMRIYWLIMEHWHHHHQKKISRLIQP